MTTTTGQTPAMCEGFYHEVPVPATQLAPQCTDLGAKPRRVSWIPVCDPCARDWYDGADFTSDDIPPRELRAAAEGSGNG